MAITSYSKKRHGRLTKVTVVSDLTGTVYYHWYLDGAWLGVTTDPNYSIFLEAGEQAELVCIDTNSASFDGPANAPAGYPARRALWWNKCTDADVDHYRVEYGTGFSSPSSWTLMGTVKDDGGWSYRFLSHRLTDLTWYWFRIVPVDLAGNQGTALALGPDKVVRTPDAPEYSATYNSGTQRVTFAAA